MFSNFSGFLQEAGYTYIEPALLHREDLPVHISRRRDQALDLQLSE